MNLLFEANKIMDSLIPIRRDLHQHPELNSDLPYTRALVERELGKMGLSTCRVAGGIVASLDLGKEKTVLLRADMDALPMNEESGLEFASKNPGAAHTCGHDIHTTMLLGAIRLLLQNKDQLNVNCRFMFQDDEEGTKGCQKMIEAGVLEGIDWAFAVHVKPMAKTGSLNLTHGQKMASYDRFVITVNGKGGHGAMPKLAIDPIKIASKITVDLDDLVETQFGTDTKCVLNVCTFHAGTAANIIPAQAVIEGTMRCTNEEERMTLKTRIREIADQYSLSLGATADITYPQQVPSLFNDPALVDQIQPVLKGILGDLLDDRDEFMSVSEDFAFASLKVPTVYMNLGTGFAEEGCSFSNHNPKVIYDENCMPYGISALVACAMAMK